MRVPSITYSVKRGKRDTGAISGKCRVKPQAQPDRMLAADSSPRKLSKEWTNTCSTCQKFRLPHWTRWWGRKRTGMAWLWSTENSKSTFWAKSHHSTLNCDGLVTMSDEAKYWEADLIHDSPFHCSSTFQAKEISFPRERHSSQCMASSGKTKIISVTSTSRYPLFLTYLLGGI